MGFRLGELELRQVVIPFRFAFTHAQASRKRNVSLIVRLRTEEGEVGYGEVLPRRYLTGETLAEACRALKEIFWPAVKGLSFPLDQIPAARLLPLYLEASRRRQTAAYCGLDLAVWDLWAKLSRRPGAALFEQRRSLPAPVTGPLGANSLAKIGCLTTLMRFFGYQDYKLKVGNAQDVAAVRLVRRLIGPYGDLRVDANGAWEPAEAVVKIRQFRDLGVSSVEQPLPPGDPAALARVQREGGLPVMADESLCTLEDAKELLTQGAARLWNLRLAKNGGFTGILALLRVAGYPLPAAAADLPWPAAFSPGAAQPRPLLQLGVLVGETSLLGAATRACLGLAPFRYLEYGFPKILLAADPFSGDPGGYLGRAYPLAAAPGLGVTPKPGLLEQLTVARQTLT